MMAVLAEITAQVLVSDTLTLPVAADRVNEIVPSVHDLQCFVIDNRVIFVGILRKQIIFVDLNDSVRHASVDIPFSDLVAAPGVPAGSNCQLTPAVVFLNFRLLSPVQLHESVVVDVAVVVTDDTPAGNTVTFANTLPTQPLRFGPQGVVRATETGIQAS